MNTKKKVGIIAVVVILAIAFIAIAFLATQKSTNYYTRIDNDWVTEIAPHEAMYYRYTLAPFRGVVTWAEAQFEELPDTVQEKYSSNL